MQVAVFLVFFCFCLSLQFAAVDCGRVLHSAMPPFAPHHTTPHSLSRPRIHQSSNCRRAHTRAHTGVVVWKRAQAAYTNTHTENKTAGGSSPQQNILSARRWLSVYVCFAVYTSVYMRVCMCVCMFAVHVVIEFERCCCHRRRRLLLSRNFLFL